jgi:predicted metallo-beta-lactamase superfamily hydrolase
MCESKHEEEVIHMAHYLCDHHAELMLRASEVIYEDIKDERNFFFKKTGFSMDEYDDCEREQIVKELRLSGFSVVLASLFLKLKDDLFDICDEMECGDA